jgi:hypothetical protein
MIDCRRLGRGRFARGRAVGIVTVCFAAVAFAGCDIDLQKIIDEATKGAPAPVPGGNGPGGGSTGAVTPPPSPGKPECKVDADCGAQAICDDIVLVGDETTCRTVSEWKLYSYEACLAKKMVLVDYSAGGGDCGPDSTRMVKYQCCEAAPPSPPVPPPAPPAPPTPPSTGVCTSGHDGGETSCKSPETWKSYASETCAGQGLLLTDIAYGTECGGGNHRYMKYLCCPRP